MAVKHDVVLDVKRPIFHSMPQSMLPYSLLPHQRPSAFLPSVLFHVLPVVGTAPHGGDVEGSKELSYCSSSGALISPPIPRN